MRFEVFGRANCGACEGTKNKITHVLRKSALVDRIGLSFVDMGTIQGMAEGAFYDVRQVPTTLLWSDEGEAVARWEGCVPPSAEIQAFLADARETSPSASPAAEAGVA
ncbi:MAG: hypothetical protein WBD63_11695 [Phycisphaerae bacterium]|nr:hypothetical protein [Phycisphaerae bacterium]